MHSIYKTLQTKPSKIWCIYVNINGLCVFQGWLVISILVIHFYYFNRIYGITTSNLWQDSEIIIQVYSLFTTYQTFVYPFWNQIEKKWKKCWRLKFHFVFRKGQTYWWLAAVMIWFWILGSNTSHFKFIPSDFWAINGSFLSPNCNFSSFYVSFELIYRTQWSLYSLNLSYKWTH